MPVCNVLACNVLAEMEYRGILVDTAEMRRQLSDLDEISREYGKTCGMFSNKKGRF